MPLWSWSWLGYICDYSNKLIEEGGMMEPETKEIETVKIKMQEEAQPRCEMDFDLVKEYGQAYMDKVDMPPIVVFFDGCHYWLADGYHRVHAVIQAPELYDINAIVHQGTPRDAILYACGANSDHGKRRTNRDKRKAALTLLNDDEWKEWSNREIAKRCKVSEFLVRTEKESILRLNRSIGETDEQQERTFIHHKTGKEATMKTSNIGKIKPGESELTEMEVNKADKEGERIRKRVHEIMSELEELLPRVCVRKSVLSIMGKLGNAVTTYVPA